MFRFLRFIWRLSATAAGFFSSDKKFRKPFFPLHGERILIDQKKVNVLPADTDDALRIQFLIKSPCRSTGLFWAANGLTKTINRLERIIFGNAYRKKRISTVDENARFPLNHRTDRIVMNWHLFP
jgi:hypothetical protein